MHNEYYNHMLGEPIDVLNSRDHYDLLVEALNSTETSSIDNYVTSMSSYYDNLTYNLGMNYKGSCGYVAIAMLLSFYDTFLNDEIIPENYDIASVGIDTNVIERRNSPGVLRDIIENPSVPNDSLYGYFLSASDYYMHMEALANASLHARLITIANSQGYYVFSDDTYPAGSTFTGRLNIINIYLQDVLGYINGVDYSIDYDDSALFNASNSYFVRKYTIQKIKEGYPVLLAIGKSSFSGGHVVIAYEYDENTDEIYTHMGWGSSQTRVTIESQGFNIYRTALIIDFESVHSHSNNYEVNEESGKTYYCYCSPFIHTHHQYDFSYTSINNTQHKTNCKCGDYKVKPHIKRIFGCNQYCYDCDWGEAYHLSHFLQYNSTYHYNKCLNCFYQQLENHKLTYDPNTYRIYCSLCGYLTNDYVNSIGYYVEYLLQKQIIEVT